ncbi:MAG: Rrf2 family transcriptional regulator [Thermostichales cyanobacterium SZTDM-1c_bins_54]
MLRLTTRTAYSIKALLDLTIHAQAQPVSGRSIAQRQQIPPAYLEKLLLELRQAKLVRSQRGSQGGYRLARPPRSIRLWDILEAVGEQVNFLTSRDPEVIGDSVMQVVEQRLQTAIHQVLQQITLEDLYFDARSHQAAQESGFMV